MWGLMLGIIPRSSHSISLQYAFASLSSRCDLHAGEINDEVVQQLFTSFDTDNSGEIDTDEMKGLLLGISLSTSESSSLQDTVNYYMKTFDSDNSGAINYEEFRKHLIT